VYNYSYLSSRSVKMYRLRIFISSYDKMQTSLERFTNERIHLILSSLSLLAMMMVAVVAWHVNQPIYFYRQVQCWLTGTSCGWFPLLEWIPEWVERNLSIRHTVRCRTYVLFWFWQHRQWFQCTSRIKAGSHLFKEERTTWVEKCVQIWTHLSVHSS